MGGIGPEDAQEQALTPSGTERAHRPTALLPALVTRAGASAAERFLEFFAVSIRNPHTRRAYASAVAASSTGVHSAGSPSSVPFAQCSLPPTSSNTQAPSPP
jgi:hypothetical protein